MRIGVVADTHLSARSLKLPRILVDALSDVDLIIHAGDFTDIEVAEQLAELAPLEAVAGNNDGAEIISRFGKRKLLEVAGFRIGLIHGDGWGTSTERRAYEAFRTERVDLIIFGHSHVPCDFVHDQIRLFNPGSPTDKRRQELYSFGLIELGADIQAKHIYYADKSS